MPPAAPTPMTTAQRAAAVYGALSTPGTTKTTPGKSETKRGLLGLAAAVSGVLLLIAVIVGALNANNTPPPLAVQPRSEQTASMKTLGPLGRGEVLPLLRATDALTVSSNPDGHTAYVTVPGTPAKGTADADRIISGRLSDGRWVVFVPLASGSAKVGDVYSLMWVWIDSREQFVGEIPAENGGLGLLSTTIRNGQIYIRWPVCCPRATRTKVLTLDGIRLRLISDTGGISKSVAAAAESTPILLDPDQSLFVAADVGESATVKSGPVQCFESPEVMSADQQTTGDAEANAEAAARIRFLWPGSRFKITNESDSPVYALEVKIVSGDKAGLTCWISGTLPVKYFSNLAHD